MIEPRFLFGALMRAPLWIGYALAGWQRADTASHARDAIGWLLQAAKVGDGGFAHSLHFARGWLPAYPETTGYILPTLDLAGRHFRVPGVASVVTTAWRWLQGIQRSDGAFPDLAGRAQVFDTGQILIGACYLVRSGVPEAVQVALRCCDWLLSQQADDGSFVSCAYDYRPHAYYSRVGAALLDAGQLLGLPAAIEGGIRNLEWTIRQQRKDGWFDLMSFGDDPPYSHTIVYTLEGLLAGYRLSGESRMLDAVVHFSTRMRDQIAANRGVIRSQYREGFVPVNGEVCVTGLCQWAAHCFRLARLGVSGFASEAEKSLETAMRFQLRSPLVELNGALPGSVPLYGRYMRFALPNWGVKFFLDALLEADGVSGLLPLL